MAHHWIRLASNPLQLKVVSRAANTLGIHKAQALGHLSQLWSWLSERSDDGSIVGISDDELEDAVEWTGTRGAFALFVRNRHVDKLGRIKDWEEFMGPLVKARAMARERQRNHRERLKRSQDADADMDFGGGNGSPVTRDNRRDRDGRFITRDEGNVTRDTRENYRDRRTDIELRKSIRTTGIYLSRELELVSSEGLDEKAFKSSLVTNQNQLDASQVQGIELVRAFCFRFYRKKPEAMLEALKWLRAVLRPAGVRYQGETVRATPLLVVKAMNETLHQPPAIDDAAIVFVKKKLVSGKLHETRTAEGELVTEALANQAKLESRDITAALLSAAPELFAGIKSMPSDPRKPQAPRNSDAGRISQGN